MLHYTMQQAKRDFSIAYLTKFQIERVPMDHQGWLIKLGEGNSYGVLVDARIKQPRVFKTLDGAVSTLQDIGFEVNLLY